MKIFKTMTMIAAVCLALTGCTKEQTGGDNAVLTVLKASFGEPVLKAAADVSGKMTWEEGDAIGVLTSSGNLVKFELSDGAGETSATFSARLAEGETVGDFAVYPYAYFSYAEGSLTVNLPKGYDLAAGEKVNYPMFAKIAGDKLSFKHLCGAFRISISAIPKTARRFDFVSNNSVINGSFTIDLTAEKPEIKAMASSTAVTTAIYIPAVEDYGVPGDFEVIVPTGTYNNFYVRLYTKDNVAVTQKKSVVAENNVDRAMIKEMPVLKTCYVGSDYETDLSSTVPAGFTVVDNPYKTDANPSDKVLYSESLVGTANNISWPNISWGISNNDFSFPYFKTALSVARCKFWCGNDAGKAVPYVRFGYSNSGNSYEMPSRVNGTACTSENIASLFKSDDWNLLEWDGASNAAAFCVNTLCGLDGNETSAPVERKFYFDDFELLP